jgi:hypothetical protein
MWQCVCVCVCVCVFCVERGVGLSAFCVERYAGLQSNIPLHTEHTQLSEDDLNNDRNMLQRFKCFNINILD